MPAKVNKSLVPRRWCPVGTKKKKKGQVRSWGGASRSSPRSAADPLRGSVGPSKAPLAYRPTSSRPSHCFGETRISCEHGAANFTQSPLGGRVIIVYMREAQMAKFKVLDRLAPAFRHPRRRRRASQSSSPRQPAAPWHPRLQTHMLAAGTLLRLSKLSRRRSCGTRASARTRQTGSTWRRRWRRPTW